MEMPLREVFTRVVCASHCDNSGSFPFLSPADPIDVRADLAHRNRPTRLQKKGRTGDDKSENWILILVRQGIGFRVAR